MIMVVDPKFLDVVEEVRDYKLTLTSFQDVIQAMRERVDGNDGRRYTLC